MKNLRQFVLEHLNNLIEGDEDAGDYDRELDRDFDPGAHADAVHDRYEDDMALHPTENPDAAEEAKKRGLIYKGWGRWADQNGNVVAQTKDGKLYSVGQQPAQQPAGGLGPNGQHISPMPNKYPDTDQAAPGGGKSWPKKPSSPEQQRQQQGHPEYGPKGNGVLQEPTSREERLAQRERLLNVYMTAYDKWLAAVKDLEDQGDRNAVNTADYSAVENARKAIEDFDAKDKETIKALRAAELEKKADLDAYERAHEKGLKTT